MNPNPVAQPVIFATVRAHSVDPVGLPDGSVLFAPLAGHCSFVRNRRDAVHISHGSGRARRVTLRGVPVAPLMHAGTPGIVVATWPAGTTLVRSADVRPCQFAPMTGAPPHAMPRVTFTVEHQRSGDARGDYLGGGEGTWGRQALMEVDGQQRVAVHGALRNLSYAGAMEMVWGTRRQGHCWDQPQFLRIEDAHGIRMAAAYAGHPGLRLSGHLPQEDTSKPPVFPGTGVTTADGWHVHQHQGVILAHGPSGDRLRTCVAPTTLAATFDARVAIGPWVLGYSQGGPWQLWLPGTARVATLAGEPRSAGDRIRGVLTRSQGGFLAIKGEYNPGASRWEPHAGRQIWRLGRDDTFRRDDDSEGWLHDASGTRRGGARPGEVAVAMDGVVSADGGPCLAALFTHLRTGAMRLAVRAPDGRCLVDVPVPGRFRYARLERTSEHTLTLVAQRLSWDARLRRRLFPPTLGPRSPRRYADRPWVTSPYFTGRKQQFTVGVLGQLHTESLFLIDRPESSSHLPENG